MTTVLDLTAPGTNIADFDFVPERHLLVAPAWADGRLIVYRLPGR